MVANLKEFTIRAAVLLEKSPNGKPITIVSHSSCDCWGLLINEEGELTFGPRCNDSIVRSGYHIKLAIE